MTSQRLRVAVDIGGTFTDAVVFDESTSELIEAKSSSTPSDFARGVMDAIAISKASPEAIARLVHGTTVVINAIAQRKGVRTALVTTRGFRDSLAIGRGNRPDMYNLKFHKPRPFVPRHLRFEIDERIRFDGSVLVPIDLEQLDGIAAECRRWQVQAIAICFLHSYAHPQHEQAAAARLKELLSEVAITISSDITQEWREFERSSTAVLNAYVQPILGRYLANMEGRFDELGATGNRFVMLSNGGSSTFDYARWQPIQLVESGPAGGVLGSIAVGQLIGEPNLIALDIGGTTAKCSLIENGELEIAGDYRLERTPHSPGYPLRIPVVDIVEIGAGGGSIIWFDDGGVIRIGPLSAGAEPGPACYGLGGTEPTITDAMVIAGVIDPAFFLGGRLQIDEKLAVAAFDPIARRLGLTIREAVAGVIRLFHELTVDALKLVSVRRGHDPRDFSLIAFGGGGPMHAAKLASVLGVRQVIIPRFPGTFSAWGMLMSRPRVDLTRTKVCPLADTPLAMRNAIFEELEVAATRMLTGQGFAIDEIGAHQRSLDARYHGQEHTVQLHLSEDNAVDDLLAVDFHSLHRKIFTFALEDTPVELVNFRVTSTVNIAPIQLDPLTGESAPGGSVPRKRLVTLDEGPATCFDIFARDRLPSGFRAIGPAILEEASATTVVLPGQTFEIDRFGNVVIEQVIAR
jgi:N-methylhydantoinase A